MKTELAHFFQHWSRYLRLWFHELRLRLDLYDSRQFKKFCERHRFKTFASMEEEHIKKVQHKIAELRMRRAAQSGKRVETAARID